MELLPQYLTAFTLDTSATNLSLGPSLASNRLSVWGPLYTTEKAVSERTVVALSQEAGAFLGSLTC